MCKPSGSTVIVSYAWFKIFERIESLDITEKDVKYYFLRNVQNRKAKDWNMIKF
jgi:hypothetical protein